MNVYKFGGASINSIDRIKKVAAIISRTPVEKILIVISAMGKITNALEKVTESWFAGDRKTAVRLFNDIKTEHTNLLVELTSNSVETAEARLKDIFTEIEWMLHDKPVRSYDYYYDQVVCSGELMSTIIISEYLATENILNKWVDARDIIRTDDNFRDATVDWAVTEKNIQDKILPVFDRNNIIVTQGFIGSTDENESTTLGREGSDYTAAIFANLLQSGSVTIWKDVPAIMNADPREFPDAVNLTSLSYTEVIEMAYYGAQVIHPKTIKPLQNKSIPLYVKSFIDPELEGTIITNTPVKNLPPVIVIKEKQALFRFKSRDFAFVEDKPVEELHRLFTEQKIKPNLSQNTAISLLCSFDDRGEKIDMLASEASSMFDVEVEKGLTLLTIRHYNAEIISRLIQNRKIVLEQRTTETVQLLLK
jgi:aspartate kinase